MMNTNNSQTNTTENTLETLQNRCAVQEQTIQELTAKLNWYEEQFRLSQQKRFGASSEKTNVDQINLFDEAEQEADSKIAEPTVEEITYKRRKQKGKNDKMFEDLPVEVIEYRLTDEEL